MEHIIKSDSSEIEALQNVSQEMYSLRRVDRKPLREWGHETAGLHRGDAASLERHLCWIKEGHLVDESNSEEEELKRQRQIEGKITEKEKESKNGEGVIDHIKNVIVTDKESLIKKHLTEIEQKKVAMAEGTIQSEYSAPRFWIYLILCFFISIYVLFFYASAINASFFRSMQQMVQNNSGDDITLMLNSIFDVSGLMHFGPQTIFTFLGAFIFFGFGLLPHIFHDQKTKRSWVKVAAAILICLLVDSLLAFKIDSGIHELKTLVGVSDSNWTWYKSVNFYLVLAFGFGTYLLWGFIYEAALSERAKKNVNIKAEIEIKGLKEKIRTLELEIIAHKKDIADLLKQQDNLKIEIEKLKKEKASAALRPEELLRNIQNFYAGWLGYLMGSSDKHVNKDACESIFRSFEQSLRIQLN